MIFGEVACLGYRVSKHLQEHVNTVAQQYGLSAVTVDAVIDAYIADMCDTLHAGGNVNIPRLVTVKVSPDGYGGFRTYSEVSKVLRHELRGAGAPVKCKQGEHTESVAVSATDNTSAALTNELFSSVKLGIPGLTLGG